MNTKIVSLFVSGVLVFAANFAHATTYTFNQLFATTTEPKPSWVWDTVTPNWSSTGLTYDTTETWENGPAGSPNNANFDYYEAVSGWSPVSLRLATDVTIDTLAVYDTNPGDANGRLEIWASSPQTFSLKNLAITNYGMGINVENIAVVTDKFIIIGTGQLQLTAWGETVQPMSGTFSTPNYESTLQFVG